MFSHFILRKYSKHSASRIGGKLKQKDWPRIMWYSNWILNSVLNVLQWMAPTARKNVYSYSTLDMHMIHQSYDIWFPPPVDQSTDKFFCAKENLCNFYQVNSVQFLWIKLIDCNITNVTLKFVDKPFIEVFYLLNYYWFNGNYHSTIVRKFTQRLRYVTWLN